MELKKGLMLVFFTALVSGFSIFINKFGVAGIEPGVFAFVKNMFVAVFIFAAILLIKEQKALYSINLKQWLQLLLIGLIGGSIPFILFFKGLALTSGASAAFVHKTMFIFVAIFAVFFLKEKLNKKLVIAAILLLLGNAFLLKFAFNFDIGLVYVLIATVFWAAENTLSKYVLNDLSPRIVAFSRMFFGSLFILIYLAWTSKLDLIVTLQTQHLLWILLTSVFLFLYVTTWYTGLKHVKVTIATQILLIGSPITTLLSYAFLGTTVTLLQAAGILMLIAGVIVALIFYKSEKESKLSQQHIHDV